MLIVADALENCVDGIALGITYNGENDNAFSTFLAILLHEVPSQLGILSVLIKGGWKPRTAQMVIVFLNCMTFIGAAMGIALTHINKKVTNYASLYVAGAFLYIGLTAMLPEVKALHGNKKQTLCSTFACLLGFVLMYAITFLESDDHGDEEDGHGHRLLSLVNGNDNLSFNLASQ